MDNIILLGAGGHSVSVVDTIHAIGKLEIAGLVDNDANRVGDSVLGHHVLCTCDRLDELREMGIAYAFVSVGGMTNSIHRELLYENAVREGFSIPILLDPSASVSKEARFDVGVYVGRRAVVGALCTVSRLAIIGAGAIIEPGCDIGAFTHICAGAVLSSGVTVGNGSTVGVGAIIAQGVEIGTRCLIGPGAVVTSHVEDGARVYAAPPRLAQT